MSDDEKPTTKLPERITFHYVKSPQFRTVHADGIIGGVTPNGRNIHFATFAERAPIPQLTEVALELSADGAVGKLGETVNQTGRSGIVRELDVDVVMSIAAAKALRRWLKVQIDKATAAQQLKRAQRKVER